MAKENLVKIKLELIYGPVAAPIAQQLKLQKIKCNRESARSWQKTADAITRLKYFGFISLQSANVARRKLYNQIMKEVSHG